MKRLLISIFVLVFISCTPNPHTSQVPEYQKPLTYSDGTYKTFASMMNECKGTTVILAIGEVAGSFPDTKISITVIDSTNTAYSCRIGGTLGLLKGDTVKRAPNRLTD